MSHEGFTWRGITFEWSHGHSGYVAHTGGQWIVQQLGDENKWYARFSRARVNSYAGRSGSTREAALQLVLTETLSECSQVVDFMRSLDVAAATESR